jgi:hypothetical protein
MVLGMILMQLNRPDEARPRFEAALAIDPNFAPAREALAKLAGLPAEAGTQR